MNVFDQWTSCLGTKFIRAAIYINWLGLEDRDQSSQTTEYLQKSETDKIRLLKVNSKVFTLMEDRYKFIVALIVVWFRIFQINQDFTGLYQKKGLKSTL